MTLDQLTDTELKERISRIVFDITGFDNPTLADFDPDFPIISDRILYPNDDINQELLEIILLAAGMTEAFKDDSQKKLKEKITFLFLDKFRITTTL